MCVQAGNNGATYLPGLPIDRSASWDAKTSTRIPPHPQITHLGTIDLTSVWCYGWYLGCVPASITTEKWIYVCRVQELRVEVWLGIVLLGIRY